ncbi:class I SAM-dependent methyltransferase [Roseateles sp. NT4]|uniref:class I SAM-dependent methyltransferase n=1 Tax=Roseateles sp. NT4 TaxID=3453715 RepID=UPI003EEC9079
MGASVYYTQSRSEVLPFVPTDCWRVLEIGCSEGRFMAGLKAERAGIYAVGIEPFPDAAGLAAGIFDRLVQAPVEAALDELEGEEPFDCVVANDVLEHLVDPWNVLQRIRRHLAPNGCVVASLPNIRHWPTLNALFLGGRWDYTESGVLDRTHLRFFTEKSLPELFERAGLRVTTCAGINAGELPWKIALLNRLLAGRFDDARYRQFVCVAHQATPTLPIHSA